MDLLRQQIDAIVDTHGLAAIGVADAHPFDEALHVLEERVQKGLNGSLRFTFSEPEISTDVRASFPWARRLVVASRTYLPDAGRPTADEGFAEVARFAVDDPYRPLKAALEEIASTLHSLGFEAEVLVDDNRLVDRAAAQRAGIAWAGKSTMMLDPRHGPWIVLGSVVTDALLDADEPMARGCGTCDACIPACPTGAIVAPGVLDARLCLAAWAQTGGIIPLELREPMGNRLYGCDDCLDACPPGRQLLATATKPRGSVDLVELLGSSDDDLRNRFAHFYLPKNDADVLRRNALVVLGNQADPRNIGALAGYLGHRNPVLRAHAAWALSRMGDERTMAALQLAHRGETDEIVRTEIEAALDR